MANKLTRKKPNNLLIGRNNYFGLGGFTGDDWASLANTVSLSLEGLASSLLNQRLQELLLLLDRYDTIAAGRQTAMDNALALLQAKLIRLLKSQLATQNFINLNSNSFANGGHKYFIGGLISAGVAADKALGSVVGGGYDSGVGNALSLLPGLGLVGGLVNRAFGLKTNQAEINRVNSDVSALSNSAASAAAATSFDDASLSSPTAVSTQVNAFEGGLFSGGKAKKKNELLRQELLAANNFAQATTDNSVNNIQSNQMNNMLANYAAFGGNLGTNGANFTNGLTYIDNGGTHEQNPYEGVPMGIAPDGNPNLVELGEVIFDDYVFSKRLTVPKAVRNKYKLRSKKPVSFAEAAKKLAKESEERPNDPISKNGLDASMLELMDIQETVRTKKEAAEAKKLFNNLTPEEQVAIMSEAYNTLNTLEANPNIHGEGGDLYKISKRFTPTMAERVLLPVTFQPDIKYPLEGKYKPRMDFEFERPKFSKSNDIKELDKISEANNFINTYRNLSDEDRDKLFTIPYELNLGEIKVNTKLNKNKDSMLNNDHWLRYSPIAGSLIGLGTTLFSKPDDSSSNAILDAANKVSTIQPVSFTPIGNYATYTPFDTEFALNQANAESSATRRAITNLASGNNATAMAGILAANNNALNLMGELRRQAALDNFERKLKVDEFNRSTDMYNSEGDFKAQLTNQSALAQALDSYFRGVMAAEELKLKNKLAREQAIQAGLSSLFTSLGSVGKEQVARKDRLWEINHGLVPMGSSTKGKHGGKLRKKKKGLTY